MTLSRFNRLLKIANKHLYIKQRNFGDIGGVFTNQLPPGGLTKYIVRITKGELTFNGYRMQVVNPRSKMQYVESNIVKRGRKTIVMILRSRGWLRKHKDRSMLLWGLTPGKRYSQKPQYL